MPAQRSLLAVARTGPATRRVLDLLAAVEGDPRIEVTFAHDPGSAVGGDVPHLLAARGIRPIPFDRAVSRKWDAALTASANGPLHALDAPAFLVPHGAGHGKCLGPGSSAVSGLSGDQLLHAGSVVPAVIGLAHASDAARLARQCPPAAEFARIVGDPCWDRLAASRHRREAYRDALGVGAARLVMLSSTWGRHSLFARHPDLAARLTAELPWDDYRVALALHPAVWAEHTADNVERWLRPALDRGLILLDPDEEWRAALVAADAVIGDHGSVTLYAAAGGTPVALAAFGWAEVDAEAEIARLGHDAPAFVVDRPLEPQIEALVEGAEVGRSARPGLADHADCADESAERRVADDASPKLADRVFAHQGESLTRISEVVYGLLDLPAPARRREPLAVPLPRRSTPTLDAWFFHATVSGSMVQVTRRPVSDHEPPAGTRLLADVHAANPRHPAAATVIVRHGLPRATDLADHPAAYVAASVDAGRVHLALRGRGGHLAEVPPGLDPTLIPAAVHALVFQSHQPLGPELSVNRHVVRIAASS